MLKKLNEVELNEFKERYIDKLQEDVLKVNCLDMFGLKSYLVNNHYLLVDYNGKIETTDLQLIRYIKLP